MAKIIVQELEDGLKVEYRKEGALLIKGNSDILLTDAQLKIIRDTIRGNKSNGIVESKEKEKV